MKIPYHGAELQRFMDWYLKPFASCQARVTGRTRDLTAACIKASVDGANTPAQTREIFVRLSGNWLVVTTSIGAYTYEQCVRAYEARVRTVDGRELRIPVGDYSDLHHSSGFRAFNINREIGTHQYMSRLPPPRVTLPALALDSIAP